MPEELNLQIDVAVLCQEISKVETMCDKYNIVEARIIYTGEEKSRGRGEENPGTSGN